MDGLRRWRPRRVGRLLGVAGTILLWLAAATPAAAHGPVTGMQDVMQDYGVLVFLGATVLIGAGVLAWVTFSPQPDPDKEGDSTSDLQKAG